MCESMINLLRERIEQNYEDFKAETLAALDKEGVFELAGQISAIEDVRFFMSTHNWLDEKEAAYLLSFNNPLLMLVSEWENYLDDSDRGFEKTLAPLLGRDDDYGPDDEDDEVEYDDYE